MLIFLIAITFPSTCYVFMIYADIGRVSWLMLQCELRIPEPLIHGSYVVHFVDLS